MVIVQVQTIAIVTIVCICYSTCFTGGGFGKREAKVCIQLFNLYSIYSDSLDKQQYI